MKKIILCWTTKVSNYVCTDRELYWGIGDMVRGIVRMFQLSKKYEFELYVDIQHHPISQFLVNDQHEYNQLILQNKENILFIFPGELELYVQSITEDVTFFFTNENYIDKVTEECKEFVRKILTPNKEFQKYIDDKRQQIPFIDYHILHYRLGDDFMIHGKKLDNESIEDKIKDKRILLEDVKKQNTSNTIFMSDSKEFKEYVKEHVDIFTFDIDIGHIGLDRCYSIIKDTLVELFIITHASSITTYTAYYWLSGFVKLSRDIYNVPLISLNSNLKFEK
jgi:hypothetical protein